MIPKFALECARTDANFGIGALADRIGEFPNPRDGYPHLVSGAKEALRREADPDSGRRSGGDQVARFQGHAGGDGLDDCADVEDHVAQAGELATLAVHVGRELPRVEIVERVARDQPRPDRAEAVQALAEKPLAMALLQG